MNEGEGDIAVVLSSELIAKITQEYFNKVMFKQKVEIVDLKPASDGYMFSVAFVKEVKAVPPVDEASGFMQERVDRFKQEVPGIDFAGNGITNSVVNVRDGKGKFTKKEKV